MIFDITSAKTVPPTYSWDDGNYTSTDSRLVNLTRTANGDLIGYAPFVVARISSVPMLEEQADADIFTIFRRVNFNDYYNTVSNKITSLGFDEEFYCHVYVMPGVYQPTMTHYVYLTSDEFVPTQTVFYQQASFNTEELPDIGQMIEIDSRGRIIWKWGKLSCENNLLCDTGKRDESITAMTWRDSKCSEYYNQRWEIAKGDTCFETGPVVDLVPNANSDEEGFDPAFKNNDGRIIVLEIPPVVFLSAAQPEFEDRTSPLTVTLTPRFIKTGSFPIEKIVWDLGDGSPLLIQSRLSAQDMSPFVYTGIVNNDETDPRNYDIQYTYKAKDRTVFSFYPSITAYASSTGTYDCASTTVGPLKPKIYNPSEHEIHLIGNSITDKQDVIGLLEINNDIVSVKFE